VNRLAPFQTHSLFSFNDRVVDLPAEAEGAYIEHDWDRPSKAECDDMHPVRSGRNRGRATTGRISALSDGITEDSARDHTLNRHDFGLLLGYSFCIPLRKHIDLYTISDDAKMLRASVRLEHTVAVPGRPNEVRWYFPFSSRSPV